MKKLLILGMVILLFAFTQNASAENESRWGTGAKISLVDFTDGADGTLMSGLNLNFLRGDLFSLEISVNYLKRTIHHDDLTMGDGDLTQVLVLLTPQVRFPSITRSLRTIPYFGIGFGYYSNSFDLDTSSKYVNAGNSVGYNLNVGIECFLSENFAISSDLNYFWTTVGFKDNVGNRESVDLDALVVGMGIRYYFLF